MNDELEDIEAHLYSQVYHSNVDDEKLEKTSFVKPVDAMKRPGAGRYFQTGPWSPTSKFQNKGVLAKQNQKPPVRNDYEPSQGFYSKNCARPYKPDLSINQVVVLSQQGPIVYLDPREARKARRKLKAKEARKRKRTAARFAKLVREQILECDTVITLDDSDDDSCIVVDSQLPVLSVVDSDDENENEFEGDKKSDITLKNEKVEKDVRGLNESFTDDVILVEQVSAPIEVINLDEEPDKNGNAPGVETASVTSSDISITNSPSKAKSNKQLHLERKELLHTPDSTSNDFMGNSGIELHQKNFNFSLHGSDFNNGEFLKPAKRTETCETESSSSTTDLNTNMMKTVVFNEVEFPKDDIFSETNLESFGNFITPFRSSPNCVSVSTPTRTPEAQKQNAYSSDSSSESDFEEAKELTKKVKSLPDLSPMLSKGNVTVPPVSKKSKKLTSIGSKYDLMNETAPEFTAKQVKQKSLTKKKSKSRKKKSGTDSVDVTNTDIAAIDSNTENFGEKPLNENNDESAPDDAKQNKRKSGQMEDKADCESHSRKKLKTKKRKSDVHASEDEAGTNIDTAELLQNASDNVDFDASSDQTKKVEITVTSSPAGQENAILKPDAIISPGNEQTETADKMKTKNNSESTHNDTFEGLDIIDESFADPDDIQVVLSEAESVLSPLTEEPDINLINCEGGQNRPSTSKTDTSSKEFSVTDLQRKMSNDPKLWAILDSDKMPMRVGGGKGRRCNRCRELGHMAIRCPNKVVVKCRLCGEPGHSEPRCPNKICTQCGQRSAYSTTHCGACYKFRNYRCQLCNLLGHVASICPDLWRRYHLTTTEGPLTTYEGPALKEQSQLWCSGCARSGHLEHSCGYYKSLYPPSVPYIKSYKDIYDKNTDNNEQQASRFVAPPVNFGVNQLNRNYLTPRLDQRYPTYYNQTGRYTQPNTYFANTYSRNTMFMPNQQNTFNGALGNFFQYAINGLAQNTQTSYAGAYNSYHFEDNLPGFISFDAQAPSASNITEEPECNLSNMPLPKQKVGRVKTIFFNYPLKSLHHFIQDNLRKLVKLSYNINKNVKELKRRQVPRDNDEKEKYYELLNMVLFGVFNFVDGRIHLERLKQFKLRQLRGTNTGGRRGMLHKSYCYIFGVEKHDGVDYNELLSRI